ncbi:MAG: thiamine biosynthesis protein ThiS [Candidatus Pelagibacter sp.]|nr:thiamine biosynthesis protein ThiS [Candidatus Pelagibacter sp.]|tara:strand:+ start:1765 stop:1965 length:201 start_codon:yes stop_codon:yes gene_type:complete
MAKIQLNGKKITLKKKTSVKELLSKYKLLNKRVALELNGKIIPLAEHKIILKDKDIVEIVHFIGGG